MTRRDQVAMVTGAARGIGRALAARLVARGPVVVADLDAAALEATCGELVAGGARVRAEPADVRDQDSLERVVATAGELGVLTTACLNAGVSTTGAPVWDLTDDAVSFALDVNLWGLLRSIRAVVPAMVAHGRPGHVLVTASVAGLVTSAHSAAYAASKAGAIAVAKALRAELAVVAPQLSVTVLNPGMVRTNLIRTSAAFGATSALAPDVVEVAHRTLNTLGADPDEIARAALAAMDAGRFWVLPEAGDPFAEVLAGELDELADALGPRPAVDPAS